MNERDSQSRPSIDGRVVVITGASRGLGKALAMRFADHGASLGLIARNKAKLSEVAGSLATPAVAMACDVTDKRQVDRAFQAIKNKLGSIDVVVANAGGQVAARRADELPIEKWREMIDLNLTGAYIAAQSAYSYLCKSDFRRLVFVSSSAAKSPASNMCAYAAAKAGMEGLVRALAVDWAPDGICVNALSAGLIENSGANSMPNIVTDQVVKRTLLKRAGKVREMTDAALFLAGAWSSYTTGHVLTVDGGFGLGW